MVMDFFSTVNGIPLHIYDTKNSDKPCIFFLHGYLETLYIWEEFVDYFKKDFRIIRIDLPGHGLSGSIGEETSMKFSADVCVEVLNLCGVEKCILVGHSMGGYIAQSLSKYYQGRVEALINLNSNPYADAKDKLETRNREIEVITSGKLFSLAQLSIPQMYFKPNLRPCDEKIYETIELCETHNPKGIISNIRGLISREDNVEFLKQTLIPTLFVFGSNDTYFPLEAVEGIRAISNNICVEVIENSGHNSFIEQPELTYRAIMHFLENKI